MESEGPRPSSQEIARDVPKERQPRKDVADKTRPDSNADLRPTLAQQEASREYATTELQKVVPKGWDVRNESGRQVVRDDAGNIVAVYQMAILLDNGVQKVGVKLNGKELKSADTWRDAVDVVLADGSLLQSLQGVALNLQRQNASREYATTQLQKVVPTGWDVRNESGRQVVRDDAGNVVAVYQMAILLDNGVQKVGVKLNGKELKSVDTWREAVDVTVTHAKMTLVKE